MARKAEKNKLKVMLQKFDLQAPAPNFTTEVMSDIKALAEESAHAHERLSILLKQQKLAVPSRNFTYAVMRAVREKSSPKIDPVISRRTWAFILAFVVIYLMIAFVSENKGAPSTGQYNVISVVKYIDEQFIRFREILFYLGTIVGTIILLLTADHFIKRKFTSPNV